MATEITPSLTWSINAGHTEINITEPTAWNTQGPNIGSGSLVYEDQIYQLTQVATGDYTIDPFGSYSNLTGSRFVLKPGAVSALVGLGDQVSEYASSPPDIESMVLKWIRTDAAGVIHILPDVDLLAKDGGAFAFDWDLVPADAGMTGSAFLDGTYTFYYTMVVKGAWAVWNPGDPYRSDYGKTLVTPEYNEAVWSQDPTPRYQTKLMEFQSGIQDNIVDVSSEALKLRQAIDRKADTKEKNVMCLIVLQRAMRDMHILAFDPGYVCPTEEDIDRYISLASRESRTGNI